MQNQEDYLQFVIIASTVLVALLVVAIADLLLLVRNRKLRHKNELLETNARYEFELLKTRHEVTEQVFGDIAAELHDNIGQTLTLAVVHLNQTELELGKETERITEIRDIVRQALHELRQLSHDISKDYWSNFNLEQNLIRIADRVRRTGMMDAVFKVGGAAFPNNRDNEIILFRIVQELVQNSLKHSGASSINLTISGNSNCLHLTYSDNGKGIPASSAPQGEGIGLRMIEQRLALLRATWSFDGKNGVRLEASIPAGIPFNPPRYEH